MNARLAVYALVAVVLVVSWLGAFVIWRAAEVGENVAPLEERSFEELTVVAVGTGTERENPARLGPSTGVALGETLLLVDAGRGVAEALRGAGVPPAQVRTVLLTSLLPENTLGLDDLWLTGWRAGREEPLRVVGPAGTEALVSGLRRAHGPAAEALGEALGLPPEGGRIRASEAGDGTELEEGPLRARAGALPGGPGPVLAWRLEPAEGGRSVVVAGPGSGAEALARFARGAHALVHEAVYVPDPATAEEAGVLVDPERLEREAALHTTLEEVGPLARRAGVEHLILIRLRPPPMFGFQVSGVVGEDFGGRISVPDDGDELEP